MTLRQLFRQHGILRSSELAKRLKISRQQAHQLWQGYRGLSRAMIYRISEATGIAPADLFLAERPMPVPQRKGRPPTRRMEEGSHDRVDAARLAWDRWHPLDYMDRVAQARYRDLKDRLEGEAEGRP